ncbi:hypothetical protein ECANGB1_824 [Enterospora canceri]|uniref:Uncharacterized protein n=1 Tax=Enterospora canceri TaxID=1081671 RepID=A0A1Y1S7H8_9MICR|nr:hypothetical protein ECANGB1_824 [Enterospora canceri]
MTTSFKRILKIFDPAFKSIKTYLVAHSKIEIGADETCDIQINLPFLEDLRLTLEMDQNKLIVHKHTGESSTHRLRPEEIFRIHSVYFYYTQMSTDRFKTFDSDAEMVQKDKAISNIVNGMPKQAKRTMSYINEAGKLVTVDLKSCLYHKKDEEANSHTNETTSNRQTSSETNKENSLVSSKNTKETEEANEPDPVKRKKMSVKKK